MEETTNKTKSGPVINIVGGSLSTTNTGQGAWRGSEIKQMIPIRDLNDGRFHFRNPDGNPIMAYVSEEDEQYKVQVPELEAFAFADCIEDAMIELVAEIVQMCEEVLQKLDSALGRGPRQWKGFLQSKITFNG